MKKQNEKKIMWLNTNYVEGYADERALNRVGHG
jgi:hypothetical protein